MLFLNSFYALLLLAGCGASAVAGASVPSPTGTAASLLPPSKTCPAMRAAVATPNAALPMTSSGAHLSYVRVALGPLPLHLVYQPGAIVHFTWCALPDRSQVTAQPVPETLIAGLIGPFSTRAAAVADQVLPSPPPARSSGPTAGLRPPGPLVASTLPIQTTTWSGADASAPLTLPATLAAGYYIYFALDDVLVPVCAASAASGCRGSSSMGGIVQITPA
jgi:hypothetical protein